MTVPPAAETFYDMLSDTERRWLQERGTTRVYQADYIMVMQGQPTENIMVLRHGLAASKHVTEAGTGMVQRLYGPGDITGFEALLGYREYQETVHAVARCSVLVIPGDKFADLYRSAGVSRAFGLAMALRAQAADEQARTRLTAPLVQVARVLLNVASRTGVPDGDHVVIPVGLSQDELAAWTAVSRATIARVLGEMRGLGVIRTGYRKVIITDHVRLREIAGDAVSATGLRLE